MILPGVIASDLIEHARQASPVEACGYLAGVGSKIAKNYRLTNVDASHEHFSLDPKEQFAAVKDARARGLEILAVYHSHPETPARMSEEDLRLAFAPGIQYTIVSLAEPDRPIIKSFHIVDGKPVEEEISIEEI